MRILVCAPDIPYPPNRGGRADVWRRVVAFSQLGHHVMLVSLHEPVGPAAPTVKDWEAIDRVVSLRYSFPIKRGIRQTIRQLSQLRSLPWHAATRVPDPQEWEEINGLVSSFQPDVIWLDGPWFGEMAKRVARTRGIPILYRSHNIEFQYLRGQASAAQSWRNRFAWRVACIGLEGYELSLMSQARAVFDISVDDLQYWKSRGVRQGTWLPPLAQLESSSANEAVIHSDVLFVGNLRTPNNALGVSWLVKEILPLLTKARPSLRLRIVGSSPLPEIRKLLSHDAIDVAFDVEDVGPYLFGARVLVNPVPVGSGVQVKMLDMLATDAPIVTRRQGIRGLPPECCSLFRVADDVVAFAREILSAFDNPSIDMAHRALMRKAFSMHAVDAALERIGDPFPTPT